MALNAKRDLTYLIDKIVASELFRESNYYFRSMKKQPHGGVAHIFYPNVYLRHYAADTFQLFTRQPEKIPFFLSALVEESYQEYLQCEIDVEELCWFCFDDDNFWYVGFRLLKPKKEYEDANKGAPILWSVISSKLRFQDYFKIDHKVLVYSLVCFLIKSKMVEIDGIAEICKREKLRDPHNKYGLCLVNEARFLPVELSQRAKLMNHLLCWCATEVIQKNHLSVKIDLFKLLINKRKGDFFGK